MLEVQKTLNVGKIRTVGAMKNTSNIK